LMEHVDLDSLAQRRVEQPHVIDSLRCSEARAV
jgi:hypothetical protein